MLLEKTMCGFSRSGIVNETTIMILLVFAFGVVLGRMTTGTFP